MFPFHLCDKAALGAYLGVTSRTIRLYIEKHFAPDSDELKERLARLQELCIFPLDAAPKGEKDAAVKFVAVIGRAASCAYSALLTGDEEVAEAISSKALNKNSPAWEPDRDPGTEWLRFFFLKMVNGIAWSRNPHSPESRRGLPAMSRLRRRVEVYLARRGPEQGLESVSAARSRLHQLTATENDGRTWAAWQFLRATCTAYWLCDILGDVERLGDDKSKRRAVAFRFCEEHADLFMVHRNDVGPTTNVAAMNAWNLSQLAAISGNHYELFCACVEVLRKRYRKDFDVIAALLCSDPDTGAFMVRQGFH